MDSSLFGVFKDREGVNMIDMIHAVQGLTSKEQLPALEMMLRMAKDDTTANFIQDWRESLDFHIQAEWMLTDDK